MKILFYIFLQILYVSSQEDKADGYCYSFGTSSQISRIKKTSEIETVKLFCSFECLLAEKISVINETKTDCDLTIHLNKPLSTDNFTIVGNDIITDTFELVVRRSINFEDFELYVILKENKTLDYEKRNNYNFFIEAGNATMNELMLIYATVNVCQPPVWVNFPSIVKMNEEISEFSFNVTAVPGEGSGNDTILYVKTNKSGRGASVYLDMDTGIITIYWNDEDSIFNYLSFDVIAYSARCHYATTRGHVIVLFDDGDDFPIMHPRGTERVGISKKGIFLYNINVTDADVGYNSVYSVQLLNVPPELTEAIEINPTKGSGNTTLELKINSTKIDFDSLGYDSFNLTIKVESMKTPNISDSLIMKITFSEGSSINRYGHTTMKAILVLWMFSFLKSMFNHP